VAGALLYAFGALSIGTRVSKTVADGSIYIAILVLAIRHQYRDCVACIAHASAFAFATGFACGKDGEDTPPAVPRYEHGTFRLPDSVVDLRVSYIPQDVQPAVCDGLLRLSSHFREYFCGDLSATWTPVVLLVFLTLVGMVVSHFRVFDTS
jgi:hypothetical protein